MRALTKASLAAAACLALPLGACDAEPVSYQEVLARPHQAGERMAYGETRNQFGELLLPDRPGPFPVVVLIHGGCWLSRFPGLDLMGPVANDLQRRGYAVWNLEYRRADQPGGGWPGTFDDVLTGIEALKPIAEAKRLDLGRVVLVGHSAGGQLALWAAAQRRMPVRGVITLAGINDLSAYRRSGPACGGAATIDRLMGNGGLIRTSPAAMLPLRVPQTIVSGARDTVVPPRFGADYGARAKAAGDPATVIRIPAAGHFELIDPASPAWTRITALIAAYAQRPAH